MAGPGPLPSEARIAVWLRDGGRCLRCGKEGSQVHHRQRRAVGGHGLHNLVLLCPHDHHVEVHGSPARAVDEGFIVSAYRADVQNVPVLTFRGAVLLGLDGDWDFADDRKRAR